MSQGGSTLGNVEEWFTEGQFRRDVLVYLKRQGIAQYDVVADLSDLTTPTVRGFLRGGSLTLRTMAALARMCDMDVNAYVLTQSQHDLYLDDRHRRPPMKITSTNEGQDDEGEQEVNYGTA